MAVTAGAVTAVAAGVGSAVMDGVTGGSRGDDGRIVARVAARGRPCRNHGGDLALVSVWGEHSSSSAQQQQQTTTAAKRGPADPSSERSGASADKGTTSTTTANNKQRRAEGNMPSSSGTSAVAGEQCGWRRCESRSHPRLPQGSGCGGTCCSAGGCSERETWGHWFQRHAVWGAAARGCARGILCLFGTTSRCQD